MIQMVAPTSTPRQVPCKGAPAYMSWDRFVRSSVNEFCVTYILHAWLHIPSIYKADVSCFMITTHSVSVNLDNLVYNLAQPISQCMPPSEMPILSKSLLDVRTELYMIQPKEVQAERMLVPTLTLQKLLHLIPKWAPKSLRIPFSMITIANLG